MDFDNLIIKLGSMIGIDYLSFDSNGCCNVYFDDDEFFFEKIKDRLIVIATLGPAENKEELYREILEANFMSHDSALGSIGLNSEQEEFVLSRVFEGEENYETFEESLLLMIKSVRKWKQIIKTGKVDLTEKNEKTADQNFNFV